MTPPRLCPQPSHREDCPLYDQRAITSDEHLRRLVLTERNRHGGLAALVRAEAAHARQSEYLPGSSEPAALPPASNPSLFAFRKTEKGATNG
jgi:hypothetical protein